MNHEGPGSLKGVETIEKNTLPSKEDIAAEKNLADIPEHKLSRELSLDIETYDQRRLKKTISRDGSETAKTRDMAMAGEYQLCQAGR